MRMERSHNAFGDMRFEIILEVKDLMTAPSYVVEGLADPDPTISDLLMQLFRIAFYLELRHALAAMERAIPTQELANRIGQLGLGDDIIEEVMKTLGHTPDLTDENA